MTPLTQQALESYLWGAAVILRGLVDAADYKQFVFPLLFYIDEIVRLVRFPGWQHTSAGEREVKKALRKALLGFQLHQDAELFERA